jgi:hypothetical protein
MSQVLESATNALKSLSLLLFKLVIAVLNLFRSPVYDTIGADGYGPGNRPDLRACLASIRGTQRLGIGCALIAWQRGAVFKATGVSKGHVWWGVYTEDFEAIQSKWTF